MLIHLSRSSPRVAMTALALGAETTALMMFCNPYFFSACKQHTSPEISRSHHFIPGIWVSIGRTTRDDPGCSENVTSGGLLGHFRRPAYLICSALQARKVVVTLYGCIKVVQHTSCSGLVRLSSSLLSAFSVSSTS
ncbi:hypothetical protein EDB89DRAFT_1005562 [Lactarius sanguifluus]|nr:hypothetical protein EDB89DRAFT_1005562 [Lactarius sanguifluus]